MFHSDPAIPLASSQQNLYDRYLLLCVQYLTPDDGQKTCLKHVQFYSKNKFENSVHLVGFIIRIYQDARCSECQKQVPTSVNKGMMQNAKPAPPPPIPGPMEPKLGYPCLDTSTPRASGPNTLNTSGQGKCCPAD